MDRELLIEIGCEEIPASWLPGLTTQVGTHLDARLKVLRLTPKHELRLAAIQTAYPDAVRQAARLLLRGE